VSSAPETFGRYTVFEQLGKGGLSTVHLAEEKAKDGRTRKVALKRLLPEAAAKKELRAQFAHEAKLLQYIKHPNIAATYAAGNVREVFFIAMEYVRGPTLKDLLRHVSATIGHMPTPIVLGIIAEICDALDHAHNQSDENGKQLHIVHRDVSPQNIIISDKGVAKLIDFGLAKAKVGTGSSTRTGQGVIKGKFNYLAPEYLAGKLDARCDIWALGVVMYEMLTSRRLFDAPDIFDLMTRIKKFPIPRPSMANPRVTPDLDQIVMTALERNPTHRWQTAAMMRDAVRGVISQPGNFVDHRHVADWMRWLYTQAPGTESSGVSELVKMTTPKRPPPTPVRAPAEEMAPLKWLRKILPRGQGKR
jgi:serine/threonine protein kinase